MLYRLYSKYINFTYFTFPLQMFLLINLLRIENTYVKVVEQFEYIV